MSLWSRLFGSPFMGASPSRAMTVTAAQLLEPPTMALLDTATPGAVSQPLYRQVAVGWLFNWLAGVPDPDEVLRRTGRTRADLRQLLRDAEVSQVIDTRRDAVIATPWHIEGGAARGAKFVTAELTAVIEKLIVGLWTATLYGYSVGEVVYARRGPNIGIEDVHFPRFEWFRPLPGGQLRYFPVTGEGGFEGIDVDKAWPNKFFLTTRNADDVNPYGEALLSVLYWPVTWRLQGWQLWLNFLETFGAPIIVGKTGSYEKFVEAMQAQGVTRTVGWQPTGPDDTITTISANRAGEFDAMNQALNETIQRVVLGQTLTSNIRGGGSYAAAKVHNEVRDDKRRADVRMVVATAQRVVNALWTLNAFPGDPPIFEMQDDVGLELERATRDATSFPALTASGLRLTKNYWVERYDYNDDDLEDIPAQAAPSPGGANPAGVDNPTGSGQPAAPALAALLGPARFTPEQQALEREIDDALPSLNSILTAAEINAAIRIATSRENLIEHLSRLLPNADAAEFRAVVERALFAADVIGYAHATQPVAGA